MKKPKHAKKPKHEDGVDRISKLPDDILQLIISRIPSTEEVIRTSILSTRWRNQWTLTPSIDIDYTRGLDPLKEMDSKGFKDFVYWVLLNKPLDLGSFQLRCGNYYKISTIRQWIHAAVMRKVKLLDLTFRHTEFEIFELPHCLVTCGSLQVLRLCLNRWPLSSPKITGFLALTVLELKELELFYDNGVKYILERCPVLEDLSLIDCSGDFFVISCSTLKNLRIGIQKTVIICDTLEICCPKLEFLKLTGYVATKFLFENLHSLKKAVIHPEYLFEREAPSFDLFATISHVEYLSIGVYCIGQCFDPEVDAPISLPNLKTLEITLDDFGIQAVIPFLRCLPDLESLHLIIPKDIYRMDELNLDEAATMSILTCHLKKVEFFEFDEEKPKLDIARALLEDGNLLEEMVFSWGDEARFH